MNWTHKVIKEQRGHNGNWFRYPTATTGSLEHCSQYAEDFAQEQAGVGGTRIAVYTRGMKLAKMIYVK